MALLGPAAHPSIGALAADDGGTSSWFRSKRYDLWLTLGVLAFALLLGGVGLISAAAFSWILLADIWLVAHPHVAAMYTRVAFDRASRRKFWFLLAVLPPVVLLATVGTAQLGGVIALFTLYYFWQTWHYTRQSYGIARALERAAARSKKPNTAQGFVHDRLTTAVIYAFPVWGLMHRAQQSPSEFYYHAIVWPPVPPLLAHGVGAMTCALFGVWVYQRVARWRRGERPGSLSHTLFVLSHVLITCVSYVFVEDITAGWLFVNIWHNAQYLVFVWDANARRFDKGVEPSAPFLSKLSQPRHIARYAAVCVVVGVTSYWLLGRATNALVPHLVSVVLIVHLAVNFHHYLIDAVIWRKGGGPPPVVSRAVR